MHKSILALSTLVCLTGLSACSEIPDLLGKSVSAEDPLPFAWPPVAGEAYPNLKLRDVKGRPFDLSSLRGNVILIEPVGMT